MKAREYKWTLGKIERLCRINVRYLSVPSWTSYGVSPPLGLKIVCGLPHAERSQPPAAEFTVACDQPMGHELFVGIVDPQARQRITKSRSSFT